MLSASTVFEEDVRIVELAGARNEVLDFCLGLRCSSAPLENPQFTLRNVRSVEGPLLPVALRAWRMHRIAIRDRPGWHIASVPPDRRETEPLDILVPVEALQGLKPNLPAAGREAFYWFDFTIPPSANEGHYAGELVVSTHGKEIATLPIRLTVWPLLLPDQPGFPIIVPVDLAALLRELPPPDERNSGASSTDSLNRSDERRRMRSVETTVRLLREHGLVPVFPALAPIAKVQSDGTLSLDWSGYDRVAQLVLDDPPPWDSPSEPVWPMPSPGVGVSDRDTSLPGAAALRRRYLGDAADHFRDKNWLGRVHFDWPRSEAPWPEAAESLRIFTASMRHAAPGVPVVCSWFPQDVRPYGWAAYSWQDLSDAVDVWRPSAQFYEPEAMAAERRSGRRTWLTVDRPPFSGTLDVQASPADVRMLPWQARALGAQALVLGTANPWPASPGGAAPDECLRRAADTLLFPGGAFGLNEPLAGVRLKHLRRGIQDAAYARLADARALPHLGDTLARGLVPQSGAVAYRTHCADGRFGGWATDWHLYESARRILADALRPAPSEGAEPADFASSVLWRSFLAAAGGLRLEVDGVRVRPGPPEASSEWRVEVHLWLRNDGRLPWEGAARAAAAPAPPLWRAEPVSVRVPPREQRRLTLAAADASRAPPIGRPPLSIELMSERGIALRRDVRVSFLAATYSTREPIIDGDLSDWPPGTSNVADDFRLICGGAILPRNQTLAFVQYDERFLYIGIRCQCGPGPAPSGPRDNVVRYDDLIPRGGDLIELLIDPRHLGTRSPSDLFHVVVKRNGGSMTEKGLRLVPPVGTREPWPADLDAAVAEADGRWTAELRIPLAALGPTDATVWGFNITRFDEEHQEFSTWSGATSNAYDPLTLGNLWIPRLATREEFKAATPHHGEGGPRD